MVWQTPKVWRVGVLAVSLSIAAVTPGVGSHLAAQDAAPPTTPEAVAPAEPKAVVKPQAPAKPKKRRVAREAPPKPAETKSPTVTPVAAPATATATATDSIDFAAQLDKAGASTCRDQVNALAASTMGSVVTYNTMSNWSEVASGKHAVSVAIGQKYADGSAVPFSVSQVISAPNPQGTCDSFSVRVLPSPLSCSKLRETLAAQGKQIGDLAGIPLMQDGAGRTMLVPTAANTCVLVATRTIYAR